MESLLSLALLLIFTFSTFFFFFYFNRSRRPAKQSKSGPGSFFRALRSGDGLLDWTTDLLANSPTHTITNFVGVFTADPSNIEHILKTRFDNYIKPPHSIVILSDFLGRGIFVSDGDHWKTQRRSASIHFSTKTIRSFVMENVRFEAVDRLLPHLSAVSASGETVDLQEILERFAFDNVCKVAFDMDPALLAGDAGEGFDFARDFEEASNLSLLRYHYPFLFTWKLTRLLGLGQERRLRQKIAAVHQLAMRAVRSRKLFPSGGPSGDDFLSRFVAEADYDDEFLRDIIISFVLAGRDTTSATLTWFFWLLSTHPEVKDRIAEEMKQVRSNRPSSDKDIMFSIDELREMNYLHAALSETLRLYPPVPLNSRSCRDGDVLPDGTAVGKGRTVMYNSYAMARMEGIWGKDCREFRPQRWLDRNGVFEPKSPFRFPIFHAGPRMCLGKEMAYIQMKAVAAVVMEKFDIDVVEKEKERKYEVGMVMKMKEGLMVKVREKRATVDLS